jgi:hypothetical protein
MRFAAQRDHYYYRFFIGLMHSTDGITGRHIIGLIYSPFLYIGVKDLICWCNFVILQPSLCLTNKN